MSSDQSHVPIEVSIEHLVVDSLTPIDRHALSAAIQGQLLHLLSARSGSLPFRHDLRLEALRGRDIRVDRGPTDPARTGGHIAHAIYSALEDSR
jgi:hypothetical protein